MLNFEEDINRHMKEMGLQQGGAMVKIFKSPQKKYINFKTTKRPATSNNKSKRSKRIKH